MSTAEEHATTDTEKRNHGAEYSFVKCRGKISYVPVKQLFYEASCDVLSKRGRQEPDDWVEHLQQTRKLAKTLLQFLSG